MRRATRSSEADEADEAVDDLDDRPQKRQRKQRPCYSCAEYRRLKMKCDRQVPCSNCTRRQRVEYCVPAERGRPKDGSSTNGTDHEPASTRGEVESMAGRTEADDLLTSHNFDDSNPMIPDFGPQQTIYPIGGSTSSQRGDSAVQYTRSNRSRLDQLADFANSTEASQGLNEQRSTHLHGIDEPSNDSASAVGAHVSPAGHSIGNSEPTESYGTLMLSKGGRSKYLGPTAGSEWLKESETQEALDTPNITRAPSPEINNETPHQTQLDRHAQQISLIGFPFNGSSAHVSTRDLLSSLPPRDEAWTLVESYYRYCAWHHDAAPKVRFEKVFDRVYALAEGVSPIGPANPQEIALVYIIIAQGTMFNIEMPNNDSSAEDWLHLSERALVKGEFLSNNMVTGIQTLHLMAHLHLQLDKGRRGDNAWPLWGLVMRLIQAMGMHRDPDRWNLPPDVADERRKVFWECNSADTFQAHCFSRPSAINPDHCDTAFPSELLDRTGQKTYSLLRFELSQISSSILNMAMKVQKSPYSDVTFMDARLSEFERSVPFRLRCRAALLAMPSRYPQAEPAVAESPEPSRRSMTLSFQQTNIALNIAETVINLHRPYYAKALYEDVESVESIYAPSYLTVIERCALIISIVTDIHARFPVVSIRQWNLWFHVFGSALCLGTMILKEPKNVMAGFVLDQIEAAISLFTSLNEHGANSPRYRRNLQYLIKLRARAHSGVHNTTAGSGNQRQTGIMTEPDGPGHSAEREHAEDIELLGWRTRLIERAGQGRQKYIRIINGSTVASAVHPSIHSHGQGRAEIGSMGPAALPLPQTTPDSTNDLLGEFWDPMLLHDFLPNDSFTDVRNTWWWDASAAGQDTTHSQL